MDLAVLAGGPTPLWEALRIERNLVEGGCRGRRLALLSMSLVNTADYTSNHSEKLVRVVVVGLAVARGDPCPSTSPGTDVDLRGSLDLADIPRPADDIVLKLTFCPTLFTFFQ